MSQYILLATYNGAAFLAEQLESILSQADGWKLLVGDDGSGDGTRELVGEKIAAGAPVILMDAENQRLGAGRNFARLLARARESGAEYCCLSDQDDVWLPTRLTEQATQMQALERRYPGRPILLHSDLEVVDADLETIHPSFMRYQGIAHESTNPLPVLLCQNFVTGCTVMINRSLLELALPVPREVLMHDWWLALCAAVFGQLAYTATPLVKYRQHGRNEIGARNIRGLLNPLKHNWHEQWRRGGDNLARSFLQARALAERLRERQPKNPHLPLVAAYSRLPNLSPLERVKKVLSLGIHMQSTARQPLLLARLLFFPCQIDETKD